MYTRLFSLKNSVSLSICPTYYYLIMYVDYIDIQIIIHCKKLVI